MAVPFADVLAEARAYAAAHLPRNGAHQSPRMSLEDAPKGYDVFRHKEDCTKVVLEP